MLKPGFIIDGADPDNVGFTAGARITFLDVGQYRSEVRLDLSAGSFYLARGEYYHPLSPSTRWFIAPRLFAADSPLNLYSRDTLLAEFRLKSAGAGADVGMTFDRFSELRVGYESGYLAATHRIGSP